MKQSGLKSFQKLVMYFIKKGKRSLIEKKVRSYLVEKKKLKESKSVMIKQTQQSLINVTPYVRLLMRKRRRGKRVIYKTGYLEKKRSYKKAYLAIAKPLRERKKEYFLTALRKEIKVNSSQEGALVIKRDDIHKKAKRFMPFAWRRKLRRKKKNAIRKKKKAMREKRWALAEEKRIKKNKYKNKAYDRSKKFSKLHMYKKARRKMRRKGRLHLYFLEKYVDCKKRHDFWVRYKRFEDKVKRRRLLITRPNFYESNLEFTKNIKRIYKKNI